MPYEQVRVTGVKGFNKSIDGDKSPESGTIFVEEQMDTSRNDDDEFKEGNAATAYRAGYGVAKRLRGFKFPVDVELEFSRVNDGKGGSRTVVTDVRPKAPQAKAS